MIKVIGERCMVQLPQKKTQTDSGIYLVSEEQYRQTEGEVVAIGEPGPLEVGDKILFEEFAGSPIDLGDSEPYVIVDYSDVLAIL